VLRVVGLRNEEVEKSGFLVSLRALFFDPTFENLGSGDLHPHLGE
jgi:hypothetical protein